MNNVEAHLHTFLLPSLGKMLQVIFSGTNNDRHKLKTGRIRTTM